MAKNFDSAAKVRWLFAETLVIVLGVLIALGLDDYQTGRYEQRLAAEYIQRLQEDVKQDLVYLSTSWYPRLRIKHESLDAIAPVVRGRASVPEDIEGFFRNVARGGMMGASTSDWVTDTTFRDLLSTGNLRLIRSPELRGKISSYYELLDAQLARVESRRTAYVSFVHTVIPAELREDMDLESVRSFGVDFALKRLLSDDFRIVLNEEYNTMLFMEGRDFAGFANAMLIELESYRVALE